MKNTFFVLLVVAVISNLSFADIAPDPINSRGITPIKDTKVQMVSEEVKVELNPSYAKVYCKFNMKNTGNEETLEVGFPNLNLGYHRYRRKPKDGEMKEFEVNVDGEKVDCKPKFKVDNKPKKLKPNNEEKSRYRNWFIWEMTFKKGEKKTVEVKYKQPFGQTYSPGILGKRYFAYVLETGAGWFGKIEKAKIGIKFKDMTKDNVLSASPKDNKLSKSEIIWELKNLEPTKEHNIRVNYKIYKDYETAFDARKDNIERWQDAWAVLYCATKAKKTDVDEIIKKGLKLATEEKYGREKPESRLLAIYHQVVKIKYMAYEKDKSEKNKKKVLETFEMIKELTCTLVGGKDKVEFLFIVKDFDTGVYAWILENDVCDEDYITSWKGPSMFEYGWIDGIKKLAGIEKKDNN